MAALTSCLLFLFSFGIFLYHSYPSVSVGDSGELITAAATLGIPHPPAFPTYVLLGKLVNTLLPWATAAFRINLFSALAGALAVLVLYRFLKKAACENSSALFGALLFMASLSFRKASQGSEVFALHALLVLLVYWSLLEDQWLLAAFLGGIGVGNHQTLVLVAPAVWMGLMMTSPAKSRPHWGGLIAFGLLGLSVYFAIFFRAAQNPFLNVGQGDSLERLWKIVSRANYGSFTLALGDTPDRTVMNTLRQLWRFVNALNLEITWLGVCAGLLGSWRWWEKDCRMFWALLIGFLTIGPAFFLLANLPFDAQSAGVLGRFMIVPCLLWCALAAPSLEFLPKSFRSGAGALALLPLILLRVHPVSADRGDFRAYSYGRNNLRSLPKDSVFIMDGGDDTFYTLAYLTQAEDRRKDIELHDRGGVVFKSLYGPDFRSLSRADKETRRQQVEKALMATGRPVRYSTLNPQLLPDMTLQPQGFLYAPPNAALEKNPDFLWSLYDYRGVAPWNAPSVELASEDYRTRAITPFYAFQRGVFVNWSNNDKQGIYFVASARTTGPDVMWLKPNVIGLFHRWAYEAARLQQHIHAILIYRWLLYWAPDDTTALMNLGVMFEREQRYDEAIAVYSKAVQLVPDSAPAHYNLASVLWRKEAWPEVISHFETVVRLDPNYPMAQRYLQMARQRIPVK